MFMLSAVVTLLGVISLTRLPVDLMPEFQQPTLNIRTSYAGPGPDAHRVVLFGR
jgi:HAE1 family hydrophobic/amphiphilic exporter-1